MKRTLVQVYLEIEELILQKESILLFVIVMIYGLKQN